MSVFSTIHDDIHSIFERDPAARGVLEILFCYPGFHAILFYRLGHWFWKYKMFFGDNTRIGAHSVVVNEIPPNSIVVGIPAKVVFRVEGEKRIQMDTEFMPDPQSRALASLMERVRQLEEKADKNK